VASGQQKSSTEEGERIHPTFSNDELAAAIANMSDDDRAMWLARVEAALRKRKIQLLGYLLAIVVWLVGMLFALAYYGVSEGFTGWVFLIPFGLMGLILFAFGKWSDKISKAAGLGKREAPPKS
jgi:hypothetical protein